MYRRHLRMALIRDMASNNNVSSEFLQRVTNIPIAYLAWNVAAGTYRNVKSSNTFFKVSLTSTENLALFLSKPIIKKFRRQLKAADHIAAKGLETLQAIIPTIVQQPERIYRHTKEMYDQTVESGLKKYNMVKQIGASKAQDLAELGSEKVSEFLLTPYGQICELAIDSAFDVSEIYVDHYLPPLGDERPEKVFGDRGKLPLLKRSEVLSNRFKERLYKHSLLKIQKIRLRGKIFIVKIYRFNMAEYVTDVFITAPLMFCSTVFQTLLNLQEIILYFVTVAVSSNNDALV